jgi:hypothetical protein
MIAAVAISLSAAAQTSPAPAGAMSPMASGTMAPMKPAKHVKAPKPAKAPAGPALASFPSEAAAHASCPSDSVVWSSMSKSKAFHTASSKYYGKTKHGAYVCQGAATAAGYHAAKN